MIINLSKKKQTGYHKWFAWHPVVASSGDGICLVWLEHVGRIRDKDHDEWDYTIGID